MNRFVPILAALAMAVSSCSGEIGDMLADDMIAGYRVSDIPSKYCEIGITYDGEKLLYAAAKFNPLFNFPMLVHSIMCHLQCYMDYGDTGGSFQFEDFVGCASHAEREAACLPCPTLADRNKAVSQLTPFFAAGGPTNHGFVTVGPLMHAYGGSPLCVWPAAGVVDVSAGDVVAQTVEGATPLKAGVGRGGCFNVEAWLACTNAADRPQGFHVSSRHPMESLGNYFYDALSPYFDIDWAAKGIPTPATRGNYPNSFYLTNSPAYLSAEAVPVNETRPALRAEPWRRSWEALGGLSYLPWHTDEDAFEYEAVDVWNNGVVSTSSSNAVVNAIRQYMENGHPAISNREYFPANGDGVVKNQYWGPQGYNGEAVRPVADYEPMYIFYRGPWGLPSGGPINFNLTYTFTTTNMNERTLSAPESNRVVAVTNMLRATSVKRWKYQKTNVIDNGQIAIESGVVTNDFGYGEHEYNYEKYVQGLTSYDWEMVEEEDPVTRVEFCGVTNTMRTTMSAQLVVESLWPGFPIYSSFADVSRAFTVCQYDDGGGSPGVSGCDYFISGDGNLFGGNYSSMFDFIHALVGQSVEFLDVDSASASAHPMPRTPVLKNTATPPWWDTVWSGPGNNYTIRTFGPPQPYRSQGGETNITYWAFYDEGLEDGLWWEDTIFCHGDGSVISKSHTLQPDMDDPEEDETLVDATGYLPVDFAEAKSEITFTIDNRREMYYRVKWDPVRAWGIYPDVNQMVR